MKETRVKKRHRSTYQIHYNKPVLVMVSLLIVLAVTLGAAYVNHELIHKLEQDELIYTQDKYIIYQENFNSLIASFVDIIHSYDAYMKTSEEVLPEEGVQFFEIISMNEAQYIREAQIVKDTTILFNFPYNEADIGVDIMSDSLHDDCIAKVEETQDIVFDGPTMSEEGVMVYVIHVPITDFSEERLYWGLGSIVIDAEALNKQINAFAEEAGLELLIYHKASQEGPIIGDVSMLDTYPIVYKSNPGIGWTIYAANPEQNDDYRDTTILILSLGTLLGLLLALMYYKNKMNNIQLNIATTTDPLSGLYNRRYLETVQQTITYEAILHNKSYGLMHLDLDNFKWINDQYGHLLGDRVIVDMGMLLRSITRKNELVFRIGGDEFLMIVPELKSIEDLYQFRRRLEASIISHFAQDRRFEKLGISIGIAMFTDEMKDFDSVLKAADFNMYEEKAKHKK